MFEEGLRCINYTSNPFLKFLAPLQTARALFSHLNSSQHTDVLQTSTTTPLQQILVPIATLLAFHPMFPLKNLKCVITRQIGKSTAQ